MSDHRDKQPMAADERNGEETEYEAVFLKVSDRMERLLRRMAGAGLALLIAAQLLLSIPSVRKWVVKVERLEGIPFERSGSNEKS